MKTYYVRLREERFIDLVVDATNDEDAVEQAKALAENRGRHVRGEKSVVKVLTVMDSGEG